MNLLGREREAGALRADVATLANVVYVLSDHAILRFVVIDQITSRQTLEALRTQLELCLRPQIVSR